MSTPPQIFNVVDYGADPTHTSDSAVAIQDAFSAAKAVYGGTVYFPPGYYIIAKQAISVTCDGYHGVNVIGASGSGTGVANIDYQGGDGTACFAIVGMNHSYWQGISVNLGGNGTAANQVAFDFQVNSSNLGQSHNLMERCNVSLQGTGGGHIGFRFGQYNSGSPNPYVDQGSNISGTTLLQCTIAGDYQGSGHPPSTSIGMQFGGGEVKPNRVIGCGVGGLGCDYLVGSIASLLSQQISYNQLALPVDDVTLFKPNGSNTRYVVIGQGGPNPEQCTYTGVTVNADGWTGTLTGVTRGAGGTTARTWSAGNTVKEYQLGIGVYGGSDDIVWVECGGSESLRVFYIQGSGGTCYSILGGRWELLPGYGQRFLQTGYLPTSLTQSITVKSVQLAGFSPPADGNGVIWLAQNVSLEWTGGAASPQSGSYYDGTNGYFLTNNSYGGSYGAVTFRNFLIRASASPLPWPVPLLNSWPVNADLLLMNSSGAATGRYRQIQMVGGQIQTAGQASLGFFGATPVPQQSETGTTAGFTAGSGTAMNNASTSTGNWGSTAYTFGDLVLALKNLGLLKT